MITVSACRERGCPPLGSLLRLEKSHNLWLKGDRLLIGKSCSQVQKAMKEAMRRVVSVKNEKMNLTDIFDHLR